MQAMGAVMSHMSAKVLAVLREDKPYEIRDIDGRPIRHEEARKLILMNIRYQLKYDGRDDAVRVRGIPE